MSFVLVSSLANYTVLHHDKALWSAEEGEAVKLSNAFVLKGVATTDSYFNIQDKSVTKSDSNNDRSCL